MSIKRFELPASCQIFAKEALNPEGPLSLEDGGWMVTDMQRGAIVRYSGDGQTHEDVTFTPLPNALALDAEGNLWVAEAARRALLKISPDGSETEFSRGAEGWPFLLPNDLCFAPDGWLYMTDSGIELETLQATPIERFNQLPYDGRLYRIHPQTGECQLLDHGLKMTNGICFDPLMQCLYMAETTTGVIYRYGLKDLRRETFGKVLKQAPWSYKGVAGPDGMACDEEGNVYVAVLGQGDITVLDKHGRTVAHIAVPGDRPTNIAFDRSAPKRFLVTEGSGNQLLVYQGNYAGAPMCFGEVALD